MSTGAEIVNWSISGGQAVVVDRINAIMIRIKSPKGLTWSLHDISAQRRVTFEITAARVWRICLALCQARLYVRTIRILIFSYTGSSAPSSAHNISSVLRDAQAIIAEFVIEGQVRRACSCLELYDMLVAATQKDNGTVQER